MLLKLLKVAKSRKLCVVGSLKVARVMMAWVGNGQKDFWAGMKLEPLDKVFRVRVREQWPSQEA